MTELNVAYTKQGLEIKKGKLVEVKSLHSNFIYRGIVDRIEKDGDTARVIAYWNDERGDISPSSHFLLDRISGAWDVVEHKFKLDPDKLVPFKTLVAYKSSVTDKIKWGLFSRMVGEQVWAYWEGHRTMAIADGFMPASGILDAVSVIGADMERHHQDNEPVDYSSIEVGDLVQIRYPHTGERALGLVTHKYDDYLMAKWSSHSKNYPSTRESFCNGTIVGHWKVVVHEQTFDFSAFDSSVLRTWKQQDFDKALQNSALGLTGEAGEVADLIKKAIHHERGIMPEVFANDGEISYDDVKDELSDILFYVSAMAQTLGFSLEDVAKHNVSKLEKRFPNGFNTADATKKADKHVVVEPEPTLELLFHDSLFPNELRIKVKEVGAPIDREKFSTYVRDNNAYILKNILNMSPNAVYVFRSLHEYEFTLTKRLDGNFTLKIVSTSDSNFKETYNVKLIDKVVAW